jgi:hypothetical protein
LGAETDQNVSDPAGFRQLPEREERVRLALEDGRIVGRLEPSLAEPLQRLAVKTPLQENAAEERDPLTGGAAATQGPVDLGGSRVEKPLGHQVAGHRERIGGRDRGLVGRDEVDE